MLGAIWTKFRVLTYLNLEKSYVILNFVNNKSESGANSEFIIKMPKSGENFSILTFKSKSLKEEK